MAHIERRVRCRTCGGPFMSGSCQKCGRQAGQMAYRARYIDPTGRERSRSFSRKVDAERFLALSIAGARKTMYISNSYFVPDDDFRRMLVAAAKRGVDVRLLTTGDKTDIRTTWYAGRRRYEELLSGGVRIYEYQPSMMHAKTFVIDGAWSTIGTMNFDNRSLAFNDETNLVAFDRRLGAAMDSIFLDDLKFSKEIQLEEFRRRPWHQKVFENAAHLLSRVL